MVYLFWHRVTCSSQIDWISLNNTLTSKDSQPTSLPEVNCLMRTLSILPAAALLCATVPCFGITHHHSSAPHATIRHASKSRKSHASIRHDPMGSDRATEIQQALIKKGYLSGEPSGVWDSESASAMQKFQGDNGWQTKITPDSRALIKLGLGPQQDAMVASASPQ